MPPRRTLNPLTGFDRPRPTARRNEISQNKFKHLKCDVLLAGWLPKTAWLASSRHALLAGLVQQSCCVRNSNFVGPSGKHNNVKLNWDRQDSALRTVDDQVKSSAVTKSGQTHDCCPQLCDITPRSRLCTCAIHLSRRAQCKTAVRRTYRNDRKNP